MVKFILYFTLSYSVLCVPISHRPLFTHLHALTSPYTQQAMVYLKDASKKGWEQTKKLFSNSTPQVSDSVRTTFSGTRKVISREELNVTVDEDGRPQDSYTQEERDLLNKVLLKETGHPTNK